MTGASSGMASTASPTNMSPANSPTSRRKRQTAGLWSPILAAVRACAASTRGPAATPAWAFRLSAVFPWRRAAALGPGVLLHLLEQEGLALREMEDLLYHKIGLLGVSGIMGTPAVLAAIAVVVAAQLVFTFAPFLHELFGTTPIALLDGLLILAIGVITMAVLECEKAVVRKVWSGSGNGDGRSGLAEA